MFLLKKKLEIVRGEDVFWKIYTPGGSTTKGANKNGCDSIVELLNTRWKMVWKLKLYFVLKETRSSETQEQKNGLRCIDGVLVSQYQSWIQILCKTNIIQCKLKKKFLSIKILYKVGNNKMML